jgi:glycosyltransferase involved in cell wall biosynthesis
MNRAGRGAPLTRRELVTLVSDLAPLGGLERAQLDVVEGLTEAGWTIAAGYRRSGPLAGRWRATTDRLAPVGTVELSGRRPVSTVVQSWQGRSSRRALAGRPVYVHDPALLPTGAALARRARMPLVMHHHLPPKPRLVLGERLALPRVRLHIAVSRNTADLWVAAGLPASRVEVVHNGIDLDGLAPLGDADRVVARRRLDVPDGGRLIVYGGRIDPQKGLETLIDAVAHLVPDVDGLTVAVFGEPSVYLGAEGRAYADRLRQASMGLPIQWRGHTGELARWFGAADVVVAPSRWPEPFGLVVLEAMALGVPVVATAVGGIPELLTGPLAALLVTPDDAPGLARTVRAVLDDDQAAAAFGKQGRRLVEQRFTRRLMVSRVDSLLTEALR